MAATTAATTAATMAVARAFQTASAQRLRSGNAQSEIPASPSTATTNQVGTLTSAVAAVTARGKGEMDAAAASRHIPAG
jgi:hypothetical protein